MLRHVNLCHRPAVSSNEVNLYVVPNVRDPTIIAKISNAAELQRYSRFTVPPTILYFVKTTGHESASDDPDTSIHTAMSDTGGSSASDSTRLRQTQSDFHDRVKMRDGVCVITGIRFSRATGKVEAAHIFPVRSSHDVIAERDKAFAECGVVGVNSTLNGLFLAVPWHRAFDAWQWCFDKDGVIHIGDETLKADPDFRQFEGKSIQNYKKSPEFPPTSLLEARWRCYLKHRPKSDTCPVCNQRSTDCDLGMCGACCRSMDLGCQKQHKLTNRKKKK
jgi:hypothetical protein